MSRDELPCFYKSASGKLQKVYVIIDLLFIVINLWIRMKNNSDKINLLKTILSTIVLMSILYWKKLINDVLETVSENADTNFNGMLHNDAQCATANNSSRESYDALEYLMNDMITEFTNECFTKDIIFGGNSVYNNFYDEDSVNNHDTLPNNNFNDPCINITTFMM